jgi:phosphatidylserine/phosphatidylglycerophosphate/cardiolipin synthase-like enzyme
VTQRTVAKRDGDDHAKVVEAVELGRGLLCPRFLRIDLSRAVLTGPRSSRRRVPGASGSADRPRLIPNNVHEPQFLRTLGVFCGPGIVERDRVNAVQNGKEIFPAMLGAIRSAKSSLTFAACIYWSDEIGHDFAEGFADRARAGVKVHTLVDWVGSGRMKEDDI